MSKVYSRVKSLVAAVIRPVLPASVLFCGLSVLVQGQTVDPLTGLPLDPLTGLPMAAPVAQTQTAPQAPTAQPVSTTPPASTTGFVRVSLRSSSSSVATAQRASLRVPTASSSSVGGVSRVSTRTLSTGSPTTTSFGSAAPIGTGTSTGGNAQTNKKGNTVGKWAESSNIIDMGATSGTIDLIFATGPASDQMTIYYPPRGQAGSQQIKDTGQVVTPNSGRDLAQGAPIQVDFGPGTSTEVEIVVNEGATDPSGTVWTYTGTGKGANGSTVTINGSMSGSTSSSPAPVVSRTPTAQRAPTSLQRVNLRQP